LDRSTAERVGRALLATLEEGRTPDEVVATAHILGALKLLIASPEMTRL